MTEPLVSIVIPCYNAERFAGEAIESALGQTYERVEVVVVDDGSTDNSVEVLRSFGERIRWETGPNRGACAARNRGVELARGELIQFLDADDLLHPQKLERQVAEVQRTGADVVFCMGEADDPTHIKDRMYKRRFDEGDAVTFVLRGILPTPAPLHWRENLEAVGGFREDLPCSQERELHLRLACSGLRFRQMDEVLYTVRHLPKSVSSDSLSVLDQHAGIAWRGYRMLEDRNELSDERARAFAGLLACDARVYLRHGLREKAADYFEQAKRMHPEGGLSRAYTGTSRWLRSVIGAAATEQLAMWRRKLAALRG